MDSYRVLWAVRVKAPNGLAFEDMKVLTGTESEAIQLVLRHRPDWLVVSVARERNP